MNRIELSRFLDEEQASALGWYENAKKAVLESEQNLEAAKSYIESKGKAATKEDRALYEDAKALVREAREELIFFDGVKKGIDAVANILRKRMADEELANAGKWVINPIKPRRR